jgi:hypothetical protein
MGEHWLQSKVMLATLRTITAKDSKGNVLGTMLDMAKVKNGKLVFETDKGEAIANFGTKEQFKFEAKVKRILSALHGEYSNLGSVALQRLAMGRLAYMFRKFIVPGMRRRWSSQYVNNLSGQIVEGNYITFGKFAGRLFKDMKIFRWGLITEDWNNMTISERANVKRTLSEMVFLVAVSVLAHALTQIKGDDDDEEWLYSFWAYQALRLRTEMSFFYNPYEAMKILRSPAASMSVIENVVKLWGQMIDPVTSGTFAFDRYERGPWKGHLKMEKTITNLIPGYKQFYRLRDVDELINWLR